MSSFVKGFLFITGLAIYAAVFPVRKVENRGKKDPLGTPPVGRVQGSSRKNCWVHL